MVLRKSGDTPVALSAAPCRAGETPGGAECGAGGEQRGLPSEKGGEGGIESPCGCWGWVTSREGGEEGKQQMERGKGLSPISCAGVNRAGLSGEIPPLQSKAGVQKELRGSEGLISEGWEWCWLCLLQM